MENKQQGVVQDLAGRWRHRLTMNKSARWALGGARRGTNENSIGQGQGVGAREADDGDGACTGGGGDGGNGFGWMRQGHAGSLIHPIERRRNSGGGKRALSNVEMDGRQPEAGNKGNANRRPEVRRSRRCAENGFLLVGADGVA